MSQKLIDQIYESAVVPELWPSTLGALAEIASARNGWIAVADGDLRLSAASTELARSYLSPLAASGIIMQSELWRRAKDLRRAGFLSDLDLFTLEEIERDPFYHRFKYPRGLGWAAATFFDLPTGESVCFSLERERAKGPVEREALAQLDLLRPHLGRATQMATRLRLEAARSAGATLEALGIPALVLDAQGKTLAANALMEPLTAVIEWRSHDRVALSDRLAQRLLAQALGAFGLGAVVGRSFPVRDREGLACRVAHVLPIRLSARDIFSRGAFALILTPAAGPKAPPVELLQSLFDLTPAESQVARHLASGASIDDISEVNGVSRNTIRAQLRAVMDKTGCGRQAEVVALLAGMPTFPVSSGIDVP